MSCTYHYAPDRVVTEPDPCCVYRHPLTDTRWTATIAPTSAASVYIIIYVPLCPRPSCDRARSVLRISASSSGHTLDSDHCSNICCITIYVPLCPRPSCDRARSVLRMSASSSGHTLDSDHCSNICCIVTTSIVSLYTYHYAPDRAVTEPDPCCVYRRPRGDTHWPATIAPTSAASVHIITYVPLCPRPSCDRARSVLRISASSRGHTLDSDHCSNICCQCLYHYIRTIMPQTELWEGEIRAANVGILERTHTS